MYVNGLVSLPFENRGLILDYLEQILYTPPAIKFGIIFKFEALLARIFGVCAS